MLIGVLSGGTGKGAFLMEVAGSFGFVKYVMRSSKTGKSCEASAK